MILGAKIEDIVTFGVVFALSLPLGASYILLYFLRTMSKNRISRFIYDFCYAIIVGGIFVFSMLKINYGDIKYYHIIALMMGILLLGVLPSSRLKSKEKSIISMGDNLRRKVRESKLYRIIKK